MTQAAKIIEAELETLFRVARRMTRNDADAEDLVSQTMLNALKNWAGFDGRHARSWLIKILRNEYLYMLRRRASRPESGLDDVAEPSDKGYWQRIDRQLQVKEVVQALEELPLDFRLAVTLCDMEELTYEEAAEIMEVPIGTIRSRVFRGRRLLRARLVHLENPV